MKTKKQFIKLLILIIVIGGITTGCFKRDEMEDINIITTVYPLEYVLNKLYGENSVVNSIYPDGVDIDEYKISSKEYKDFSKQNLFVYNGLSNDKDIALNLINKNKDIMIMDANFGMEIQYGIEELWLNPSNLLMISQNIKNGLTELIDSKYIKEEIEESYDELKVELSELDADIKLLSENARNKTLVVGSSTLQYLSKYGFDVILVNDETENEKNITKAINLINDGDINYIFMLEGEEETEAVKTIKADTSVEVITIDKLDNISDEERDNKKTYLTLMKDNIELLKKETE
ncbi:MAG: metal ABC transporter substrate-binding protein [Bacilli bacterium]